MDISCI